MIRRLLLVLGLVAALLGLTGCPPNADPHDVCAAQTPGLWPQNGQWALLEWHRYETPVPLHADCVWWLVNDHTCIWGRIDYQPNVWHLGPTRLPNSSCGA